MAGKGRPKGYIPKSKKKHGVPQSVEREILDAISNNISLTDLYNSNPDKYPTPLAIYTKMDNNEAFRNKVYAARKILSNILVEKLHSLRNNPPTPDNYDSDTYYKHAYNIWTKQLKSVHDELHQLGSIFNSQFTKTQKVESTDTHIQQVVIQDYKDYKQVSDNITKQLKDDLTDQQPITHITNTVVELNPYSKQADIPSIHDDDTDISH